MKRVDVIIIGAGAAGLMCGIEAGKRGRKVLILDKADKVGKKILISGGGRCNFTNLYTEPDNFLSGNPHFCKSALSRYTQWDFIALMESHELSWEEKSLGQLFCDQKAKAVVELLTDECRSANVQIELRCNIKDIIKNDEYGDGYKITTTAGDYACTSLVISTGGPSIPAMGSTDFALGVAKQFGINTLPFTPALVPFTFSQSELDNFFKDLSGISADVSITTQNNQTFKEAILFTHRGISGPAVLQASSYWKDGESISINLFPNEDIEAWLTQQREEHPLAELKTILSYKLSKRLAGKLCESLFANKPIQQYNPQELTKIAEQLNNWQLKPNGTEGLRTAEVSLGGVDTNELSSKTMESKKVENMYFIGEGVDVTGHLGGFNFQWAWASGWCAGQFV
jgi:predicted Rossmann fold flavoprotein